MSFGVFSPIFSAKKLPNSAERRFPFFGPTVFLRIRFQRTTDGWEDWVRLKERKEKEGKRGKRGEKKQIADIILLVATQA